MYIYSGHLDLLKVILYVSHCCALIYKAMLTFSVGTGTGAETTVDYGHSTDTPTFIDASDDPGNMCCHVCICLHCPKIAHINVIGYFYFDQ